MLKTKPWQKWGLECTLKAPKTVGGWFVCGWMALAVLPGAALAAEDFVRLAYNDAGIADLGVGLWAWPSAMDWDGDGDLDLVVSTPCVPSPGTWFFENPGKGSKDRFPVFNAGVLIGPGFGNIATSYVQKKPVVLRPGVANWNPFAAWKAATPLKGLPANVHSAKVRGNVWRLVDWDGDGREDVLVGVEDYTAYGWDNAYAPDGTWKKGPIRGFVYVCRNVKGEGPTAEYASAVRVTLANGQPLETFGNPMPMAADWDGDGDLDLLCGSFMDDFTYFENTGTRTAPVFAPGRKVRSSTGTRLHMDLQMITPSAVDWTGDGALDIVCGDEDGRVALLANTGKLQDGAPTFAPPRYFRQRMDALKFGALSTPVAVDWDGDGDEDLICGDSAGHIAFIENRSGAGVAKPRWANPVLFSFDGKDWPIPQTKNGVITARPIRIQAGENGSIQGPCEAKWGYTVLSVADWDGDGFLDILANGITGDVVWFRNPGRTGACTLEAPRAVEVEWTGEPLQQAWGFRRAKGKALLTAWRTTPLAFDWTGDGLVDLAILDAEGYLALFERAKANGRLVLKAPRRAFCWKDGTPIRPNAKTAGASGRRKLCVADWDGDGRMDLIVNGTNAEWWRQVEAKDGTWFFENRGALGKRRLAGHTTCPAACDFDGNGVPDLLLGAEDGFFYHLENPRRAAAPQNERIVLDNGVVRRELSTAGGHLVSKAYQTKLPGPCEYLRRGAQSEFAVMVNDRFYRGYDTWKNIAATTRTLANGGRQTAVSLTEPNGLFQLALTYTLYPNLPLVRKTLAVTNLGAGDLKVEAVNVEDLSLAFAATPSVTFRQYARYRAQGPYDGDWNDPLVVIHNQGAQNGMAIGNETPGVIKRTATFKSGSVLHAGTTFPNHPYPFRRWLKPGATWTSAAVFTAPYNRSADPQRVVGGTVQTYVRKYMGTRIEQIPHKPMFVYNTWVPFRRAIDEKTIRELAAAAADCGIEEFVIDDGWQVNLDSPKGHPEYRGDWDVDPAKFPNGLRPVFDYIKSLGMKPGLWVSLALADRSSHPYREHPEWMALDPHGRPANLHGGGLDSATSCLGTDWYDYIRAKILHLVREHGLAYVKLDLAIATSAYVYENGRSGCYASGHPGHRDHAESFDVIYTRCLELFDDLHREAPDLFIDCTFETAGKLQLMDYGFARHAEGNWLSNIGARPPAGSLWMRGYAWERTPALPPTSLVIGNLHMNGEDHLLSFKSLAGTLPIMLGDPRQLSVEERAEYRAWSTWLKGLEARHGIMSFRQDVPGFGEPADGAWDAFSRLNDETKSGGLVGVFRQGAVEPSRVVAVPGLIPEARYRVTRAPQGALVLEATGRDLAEKGFTVKFEQPYDGDLFEVARQPDRQVR